MIDIPDELIAQHVRYDGEAGRAYVASLAARATRFLEHWELRPDGPTMYGRCALVVPVLRADGTRAVLKLQDVDEETVGSQHRHDQRAAAVHRRPVRAQLPVLQEARGACRE